MTPINRNRHFVLFVASLLASIAAAPTLRAQEFESVASKVSREYVRKKAPDGTIVPESYAFAKGGYWSGPMSDPTIDRMDFMDIARTIAVPLADRSYMPTADPRTTNLLLVVYWGTTYAPENASESGAYAMGQQRIKEERASYQDLKDALQASGTVKDLGQSSPNEAAWVREARLTNAQAADAESAALGVMQAENKTRDQVNRTNAEMLGYDSEWNQVMGGLSGPVQEMRKSQMISELEEYRYFVVVMAYDYQLLVKSKTHKLLWETRFSIRQHAHAFNQQLMSMTVQASNFFGRESNGLVRTPLPEGQVKIGAVKSLGAVTDEPAKSVHP